MRRYKNSGIAHYAAVLNKNPAPVESLFRARPLNNILLTGCFYENCSLFVYFLLIN